MVRLIRRLFLVLALFTGLSQAFALNVGDQAKDFTLKSYDGKDVKLSDFKGKTVVLEWFNRGCPFVQNHYQSGNMQSLQKEFTGKGVVWLTINSTHVGHPNYLTPEQTAAVAKEWGINVPILIDGQSHVAMKYGAKSTPHMFVINGEGVVVYQGAIDDRAEATGDPKSANNYVRAALNNILEGKTVAAAETAPYGCSIKFSAG